MISLGVTVAVVIVGRAREGARRSDVRAEEEHRRADALNEQMVRQSERENIARDIHDSLTNRLAVMSMHAGALENAMPEGMSPRWRVSCSSRAAPRCRTCAG
ncbi:histidine kinase [Microbacterium sp. KUDC0406]|uniref:histidine kinase n=1 Tax=Microbacterium sp. KUDC0406 TaxID=2909588 RepID=UPI001F21043C|nr:histidine kinase [Microbacterium sp. KUDC0406]UJP09247.1 histidine kinase [Microbacterium sp. KUDC0406]